MTSEISRLLVQSWVASEGINSTSEVMEWIEAIDQKIYVDIKKTTLAATNWFYDETIGQIVNQKRIFFQVAAVQQIDNETGHIVEQPIMIQDEIGYVGILCKVFDGVLHFLMQAKIEPGNVNKIQLSPTIQATRSNFLQRHGGAKPPYLNYFMNAHKHTVIVDQIQSEQASRFLKKRNRNILVFVGDDVGVEHSANHKWLTLGQIKKLMKIDNLVNMDARTVLSCIPFYKCAQELAKYKSCVDETLIKSFTEGFQPEAHQAIYSYVNNFKMFSETETKLYPLYKLRDWKMQSNNGIDEFVSTTKQPFKVVFCDMNIEGREVRNWGQPLFEALGKAIFGLFTTVDDGVRKFLAYAQPEIGCMDKIELGPTIQMEATDEAESLDIVGKLFLDKYKRKDGVLYDVILSEEGGRFYHEQNYNVIIEIDKNDIDQLPAGYFWLTYDTLNRFTQFNNCLNIQLRNLLSLLEISK